MYNMSEHNIETNCPQEFEVRQPRWLLVISIIFLAVSIGVITYASVKMYLKVYDIDYGAMFIAISCVFLFIGVLGLYSFRHDTFKFADGEFVCKRTLRKTKTWTVSAVSYVKVIRYRNYGINILFYDKNDGRIVSVTDGKWVWDDDRLREVLCFYKIPVLGLDD